MKRRITYAPLPFDAKRLNLIMSEHKNLRDALIPISAKVIGANEHVEFAALLTKATPYRLDVESTRSLAHAIQFHAWSVEKNLDLLDVPPQGIWIEWPESGRFRAEAARVGAAYPLKTGGLIVVSPDEPDVLVVMTGWMLEDGSVRHSHAAARFSRHLMARWAWESRNNPALGHGDKDVVSRLMEQAQIYFPPGLRDEIEFLLNQEAEDGRLDVEDMRAKAIRTMQLDVVEDLPFILAAALFVTAGCGDLAVGEPAFNARLRPRGMKARIAPLLSRIGIDRYGFWRMGTSPHARVSYVPPVPAAPKASNAPAPVGEGADRQKAAA